MESEAATVRAEATEFGSSRLETREAIDGDKYEVKAI